MSEDVNTLITDELRAWIGRKTALRPLEPTTAADVRRYVNATGDANPLWCDDAFARSHGYRGRLVPPLLVGWEPFSSRSGEGAGQSEEDDLVKQMPLPERYSETRNAGTELEWLRPVYLGETLAAQTSVVDIVARAGKAGIGIYITREERILDGRSDVVQKRRHTTVRLPGKPRSTT